MEYLNIKNAHLKALKVLLFICIIFFGVLFTLNHFSQKTYADPAQKTIYTVIPGITGETFEFNWIGSDEIDLIVTPGVGSTQTFKFIYTPATSGNGAFSLGTPASFNLQCSSVCSNLILNKISEDGFSGGNVYAQSLSLSACSTGVTSCSSLTLSIGFGPNNGIQTTSATINGSTPIVFSVNQAWNNAAGNPITPASSEGSNLEFISPTVIYDTQTHAEYTTSATGVGNLYCTSGCERYLNNGYTIYWPTENYITSAKINPYTGIQANNPNSCAGGILVETNSGADLYADVMLLPAFEVGSTCSFNEPSPSLDGFSDSFTTTSSVKGSGQFYLMSSDNGTTSLAILPPGATELKHNVDNMNMEYAMFSWSSMNQLTSLANGTSLVNVQNQNPSDYNQIIDQCSQCSGQQIFTTTSCLSTGSPAFILVNYTGIKPLSDDDLTSQNATGTFYYFNNNGKPTPGWSSSALYCLFGESSSVPQDNTIETSSVYTASSPITYITSISQSICDPSISTCTDGTPDSPTYTTPGANVDACYYLEAGWTYLCGIGALPNSPKDGNEFSLYPVVGLADPTSGAAYQLDDQQLNNEYDFTQGDCYQVKLLPSASVIPNSPNAQGNSSQQFANEQAWVQQPPADCNNNPALQSTNAGQPYQPLPNLSEGIPGTSTGASVTTCKNNCIVTEYLNPLVKFLNVAVSLVVVISVVVGGIQYSSSRDNPEALKAARKRMTNALLGLVVYFFLYAFLNFIVPGGI